MASRELQLGVSVEVCQSRNLSISLGLSNSIPSLQMNIYSHHALINAIIYKRRNGHPECKLQFIPLISGRIGLEFRSLLSRT